MSPRRGTFLRASPVSFPVYCGDALVEPLQLSAFPTKLILDVRKRGEAGSAVIRFPREGLIPVASIEEGVAAHPTERPRPTAGAVFFGCADGTAFWRRAIGSSMSQSGAVFLAPPAARKDPGTGPTSRL